jgi:hypothetical protein
MQTVTYLVQFEELHSLLTVKFGVIQKKDHKYEII